MRRRPTGGDLLAIAGVAFIAGVLLAWLAPGSDLAGYPLWYGALALKAVALLLSVLAFPGWWAWTGGWSGWAAPSPSCCGREHAHHHKVELIGVRHRTRGPARSREPRRSTTHAGPALAIGRRLSRGTGVIVARRTSHGPQLRRSPGRSRG